MALLILRRRAAHFLVGFLWLLVVVAIVTGWIEDEHAMAGCLIASMAALAASLAVWTDPVAAISPLIVAAAMMANVSVLVWMVPDWLRVDVHMVYFAGMALLAGLCSAEAIWLAALLIAVHHLVLNYLLPSAIFPEMAGGNLLRVVLHAIIVLMEAGMLAWMIGSIKAARLTAETALAAAREAAGRAESESALRRGVQAQAAEAERTGRQRLADEIETGLGGVAIAVAEAVAELEERSRLLSSDTQIASAQSHLAADAATDAAQSIQAVAAASVELSMGGTNIAHLIVDAIAVIAHAVERVRAADATLTEMTDGASRVADVVQLVAVIANQTKLLALNATIEAARAGNAGQGFAVVANEVKALALQTRKATDEIGRHVAAMRLAAGVAVSAVGDIDQIVDTVKQSAAGIAAAIMEQNAATKRIAHSAAEVAGRTAEGHAAANLAVSVLETADQSCHALDEAAAALQAQRTSLQQKLDAATSTLRAA